MTAILASYENGGTKVTLYETGTKVREITDPARPPVLPEQMDLKITDWCDAGCAWCHEGSTRRGRHGDVDAMLALLADMPRGAEIAIGGGDPLSHPEFERLVLGLRDLGLVPSVTVNGRHVARHLSQLKALTGHGALFGVGVSFHESFQDWDYPHLVDHLIAGVDDPLPLLEADPRKLLILGYKSWGRGTGFARARPARVEANIALWFRVLPLLAARHHLSFDTLAITQLVPRRLFRDPAAYEARFMGAEGQYSLYVDGVKQEYALSSYAPERFAWTRMAEMFAHIRAVDDTRGVA